MGLSIQNKSLIYVLAFSLCGSLAQAEVPARFSGHWKTPSVSSDLIRSVSGAKRGRPERPGASSSQTSKLRVILRKDGTFKARLSKVRFSGAYSLNSVRRRDGVTRGRINVEGSFNRPESRLRQAKLAPLLLLKDINRFEISSTGLGNDRSKLITGYKTCRRRYYPSFRHKCDYIRRLITRASSNPRIVKLTLIGRENRVNFYKEIR